MTFSFIKNLNVGHTFPDLCQEIIKKQKNRSLKESDGLDLKIKQRI